MTTQLRVRGGGGGGGLPRGVRWTEREAHPRRPALSLARQATPPHPPSGGQVSLHDQSLKLFVRWDSPVSQSVSQPFCAEPQVLGDSAEAVGSGRAPTCATTLIPHTGGDLLWAGGSSSAVKYGVWMRCAHTIAQMQKVEGAFSFLFFALSCTSVYLVLFFSQTQTFFLAHTVIKSKRAKKKKSVCLEGLFKHASWKIYGSLELNCAGLLLEKDRWGVSRDTFYQSGCIFQTSVQALA